jgi:hypothetical protein
MKIPYRFHKSVTFDPVLSQLKRPTQFHHIYIKSILMVSSHQRLGLPSFLCAPICWELNSKLHKYKLDYCSVSLDC